MKFNVEHIIKVLRERERKKNKVKKNIKLVYSVIYKVSIHQRKEKFQ